MRETRIFSNAVVTPGGVVRAELVIFGHRIVAVEARDYASSSALDWSGDMIVPGLVDIHTDNLEKHYQPRPGALWDAYGAALAHDAQCAAAGITTVFDSLSLHGSKDGLNRRDALGPMIEAVDAAAREGALRSEHFLHLRCETPSPDLLEVLEPHLGHPRLRLLSLMDHTPGQRQSSDPERRRMRASAAGAGERTVLVERDARAIEPNRRTIASWARERGLPLAAHDDASLDHVEEAHADGCVIAEFPVTLLAARRAAELGMAVCMGGPNLVRGASHSGNLSAREVAREGLLDIVTSDYVPLSMLRSAFLLMDELGWSPQAAFDTVARNPARSVGLEDRGELAEGLRADFLRVRRASDGWPAGREVWREGERIA